MLGLRCQVEKRWKKRCYPQNSQLTCTKMLFRL